MTESPEPIIEPTFVERSRRVYEYAGEKSQAVVEVNRDQGLVTAHGILDIDSGPTLKQAIVDLIGESDPEKIIVDLRDADYIDSTCMGILVGAYKRLGGGRAPDSPVTLRINDVNISKLFEVVGLDRSFNIEAETE